MRLFAVNIDGSRGIFIEDAPRPQSLGGCHSGGFFYRHVGNPQMELHVRSRQLIPSEYGEDALACCLGNDGGRWRWIVVVDNRGLIRGLNQGWITVFVPELLTQPRH